MVVELASPYTLAETAMSRMVSSVTLSAMRATMEWALSAGSTVQMVSPTLVLTVSSHPLTAEVLATLVKESAITIQTLDVKSGVFSGIQSARKASIMLLAVSAVPIVSMGKLILELAARSSPMEEQLVFLLHALMMRITMLVSATLNADQATLE